ncbi:hypothetical protein CAAN1_05S05270 [[Candida] anglica]|uniref:UBC core domain-containing protein n=1 Tax=[Candida] anglica TaxID=148631 RepID=A0ABP0EFX5_9ASCO
MADRRLIKEYKQLSKETNPQIVSLAPDSENILRWNAIIAKPTVQDSEYYFNGQWNLNIEVPTSYPINPPKISFDKTTPIAHPNIDITSGEICLDILKSESWSPAWNIHYLVVAILMLIDDPEPDSPLNIDMANLYRHDRVAYKSMCQYNIWKHHTFYGDDYDKKDRSGVKKYQEESTEENTLAEVDEISKISDQINSLEVDEFHFTIDRNESFDVKAVHDMGAQVTEQFLAKVNEVNHIPEASMNDMDSVKRQVALNVNKQVEEICQQSGHQSNSGSKTPVSIIASQVEGDEAVQKVKQEFLRQIDQKVDEVRRAQADSNSNSDTNGSNSTQTSNVEHMKLPSPEFQPTSSNSSLGSTNGATTSTNASTNSNSSSLKKLKRSISGRKKSDKESSSSSKKKFASRLRNSLK